MLSDPEVKSRAAGVIFMTPDDEVLMLQRSEKGDHEGVWCFPGGMCEGGEHAEEAARREAEEETGYNHDGDFTLVDRSLQPDGLLYTTFAARLPKSFEPKINSESSNADWYHKDDLPQPLHPGVAEMLKKRQAEDAGSDLGEPRDRSAFLYMEAHPDTPEHAQCGSCRNFLVDQERCYWLEADDAVDTDDTCGLYGQGSPHKGTDTKPTGQYTPEQVGFFEGRVQCHRCNAYDDRDKSNIHCDLYVQLNRLFPRLWKLEEKIKPHACCNAWAEGGRDPKRFGPYGPLPDEEDEQSGGLLAKVLEENPSAKDALPEFDGVTVDRDHDGPWMSCMSQDGETMYVNSNLPETVNIKGKDVDIAEILRHHEVPELEEIRELLAEEEDPSEEDRKRIYLKAHNSAGTPNERAYCEEHGIDWDAWSAWCRGEEAKVEKLEPRNEPEDADVKPIPHGHGDLGVTMGANDEVLVLALDSVAVYDRA